jgi:hypothetical protein
MVAGTGLDAKYCTCTSSIGLGTVVFGNTLDSWAANEKICWALVDDLLDIPFEKGVDRDENSEKGIQEAARKAREQLYLKLPEASIPLSSPLSA